MNDTSIIPAEENNISASQAELSALFQRCFNSVRDDLKDNAYIIEGLKVLPVKGYRSAIGSFWNAVVDDLRNKIMARSLKLFNKSVALKKEVKTYEDFQDYVSDDDLIDGAYKIGVIGWEASKVLKHAKETRHIFDGHPKSTEPSPFKVLAMLDDCVRYVLNVDYPPAIINIDEYLSILSTQQFDRNEIAVENAIGALPEIYKTELIHRMFDSYIHPQSDTILRSNIEFVIPILWQVLSKETKLQIVHKVDNVIPKGDLASTEQAFAFILVARATVYLSSSARKYKILPLVQELKDSLDNWKEENRIVDELAPYASLIPPEVLSDYVYGLVHTYVGHMGHSFQYSRSDFYADQAAMQIPEMIRIFDDRAAEYFVECIKQSEILKSRIQNPVKMRRLRSLGNIVLEKVSQGFSDKAFLEALVNEDQEETFIRMLPTTKSS